MRQPARCGTVSGYTKHHNNNEKPCDACAKAKAEYDERRRTAGKNTIRSRIHARAQGLAERDLRNSHPAEYKALYEKYKALLFEEEGITPKFDSPSTPKVWRL